jgi:hypothetical protein
VTAAATHPPSSGIASNSNNSLQFVLLHMDSQSSTPSNW